jgi:hypothetical protein
MKLLSRNAQLVLQQQQKKGAWRTVTALETTEDLAGANDVVSTGSGDFEGDLESLGYRIWLVKRRT